MVKVSQKRLSRKARRTPKTVQIDPTSNEGVLQADIEDMIATNDLAHRKIDLEPYYTGELPWPEAYEVELSICYVSSSGLGIGVTDGLPVVVPSTLPGDRVVARVYRTQHTHVESDLVKILEPSAIRNDSLIKCKYFGLCSGCQYQEAPYEWQLDHKRQVVQNAYRRLAPKLFQRLPDIKPTVPSPKVYGYRTKLSPHFDTPRSRNFPIGFGQRGRKEVIDIEECPIATPVVNEGLEVVRKEVRSREWKRGATLLIREAENQKIVTENKEVMRERVGDYTFEYIANEFFQNNNSILTTVTAFVAEQIRINGSPPKYLVDTYCGCGLFAVTCGRAAERVVGVEISQQNIQFARRNAQANNIINAEFVVGQAEQIFAHVSQDPDNTAVVIDPPRKGCNKEFLDQLLKFSPAKVVYVSCNVHSQARDLEYFCGEAAHYKVESLGGFDFFPQTYHVEGVAVLSRI